VPNPYECKYKGVWVCLLMLARAMSGNYVNFGVFDLYGDPALKARRLRLQWAWNSLSLADVWNSLSLDDAWNSLSMADIWIGDRMIRFCGAW
jgi:hypothetical protein